jgi:hypothetical protein
VTGEAVELLPLKLPIFPLSLADKPIEVVLFVQLNEAPETALLKVNAPLGKPLQIILFAGTIALGVSFTTTCLTVVVPHSFVTSKEMVNVPAVE